MKYRINILRRKWLLCALFPCLLYGGMTYGQSHMKTEDVPGDHILYTTAEIPWKEGPASLEKGAMIAVIEGNPGEEGIFTLRIKIPDQYTIAPHSHPNVERVTVLKGTFNLGTGDTLDSNNTQSLEAGSYTSMPPGMVHYAIAKGETILQLTSMGPWMINYVNPEDDPRLRDQK